jgi:hypothetical protein
MFTSLMHRASYCFVFFAYPAPAPYFCTPGSTTMSLTMKHAADDVATPAPKKVKATPSDPTYHPTELLEHTVNDIIPNAWMDTAGKRVLYQSVVDDLEATITKMKELVHPWDIEYYETGVLYDTE